MKIKIATISVLLVAAALWSARAEQGALLGLRALGADAAPPSPPAAVPGVSEQPCSWGTYKGTCFYTPVKGLIYWIIREWDRSGPIGKTIIGYPEIREKQRDYNKWTQDTFNPPDEYPGVTRLVGGDASGWQPDGFELADSISDTGELNKSTLRIPYFKAGARIVRLWHRFQADCDNARQSDPATKFTSAVCSLGISSFDPDAVGSDGALGDQLLQRRAQWLVAAYQDTLRFDALMSELPVDLSRPEQLPSGFLARLAAVSDDMENDIRAAARSPKIGPTDPFGDELK